MKTAVLFLALCAISSCQTQKYPKLKFQQQIRGQPVSYQNTLNQRTSVNQYPNDGQYHSELYSTGNSGQFQNSGHYSSIAGRQNSGQYTLNTEPPANNGHYQSLGQYQNNGQYYSHGLNSGQYSRAPNSLRNIVQYPSNGQYSSISSGKDSGQYSPDTKSLVNSGQYQKNDQHQNNAQYSTPASEESNGQYTPDTRGHYQSTPTSRNGRQFNSGQYEKTGPYTNFGQFFNGRNNNLQYQNEGRYSTFQSGQDTGRQSHQYYSHDDSGKYIHDNSGAYVHVHDPYIHIHNPYEHVEPKYIAPKPRYTGPGIPPAGGYGPPVQLRKGNAAGLYDNRNYKIIRKIEDVGDEEYHYLYETENKIFGEEQGQLYNKGSKEEGIRAKGYYEYTGPDSNIYRVEYTADENGFIPDADHVPTPPPIPKEIARALAYKKSIGEL